MNSNFHWLGAINSTTSASRLPSKRALPIVLLWSISLVNQVYCSCLNFLIVVDGFGKLLSCFSSNLYPQHSAFLIKCVKLLTNVIGCLISSKFLSICSYLLV